MEVKSGRWYILFISFPRTLDLMKYRYKDSQNFISRNITVNFSPFETARGPVYFIIVIHLVLIIVLHYKQNYAGY